MTASAALVDPELAGDGSGSTGSDTTSSDCDLDYARTLVGQPDTPAARASLAQARGGRPVRWIRPGSVIARDEMPERLNVIVGDDGRVGSVRCG